MSNLGTEVVQIFYYEPMTYQLRCLFDRFITSYHTFHEFFVKNWSKPNYLNLFANYNCYDRILFDRIIQLIEHGKWLKNNLRNIFWVWTPMRNNFKEKSLKNFENNPKIEKLAWGSEIFVTCRCIEVPIGKRRKYLLSFISLVIKSLKYF